MHGLPHHERVPRREVKVIKSLQIHPSKLFPRKSCYMEMNFRDFWSTSTWLLPTLIEVHRTRTLHFLQDTLDICLSELDPSLDHRPISGTSLTSRTSAFAPSLSSSSLSSFRRAGKGRSSRLSNLTQLTTTNDEMDKMSDRLSQIGVSLDSLPIPESPTFEPQSMLISEPQSR